VVRFLHKMLLDAFSMRASDIHFEPYEHNYRVPPHRRRTAQSPARRPSSRKSWPRIKVISRMDIREGSARRQMGDKTPTA
jgi:type IV pilus assembly protein PilB